MARTLAITGGTGFVGGHSLAKALGRGHLVRALARRAQPARDGVTWIEGSLEDGAALRRLAEGADAFIHIAGLTNARRPADFHAANAGGTAAVRAAIGRLPLVLVSSLAARAPWLSHYGASKRQGEDIARGAAGPVVMVRPPAVYGPGYQEFLALFRSALRGVIPMPRGSVAAMIYGPDLAAALVALAEDVAGAGRSAGGLFEIDDGCPGHGPAAMADAIGAAIGRRVKALEFGRPALTLAALADSALARVQGRLPRISRDRARYMAYPDWSTDSGPLRALGLWQPETDLGAGMAATARWYRGQGLLP